MPTRPVLRSLSLTASVLASVCAAVAPDAAPGRSPVASSVAPAGPAVFTVTDTVLSRNSPRLGTNSASDNFKPWESFRGTNMWLSAGTAEPAEFRVKGIASGGSTDFLEDRYISGDAAKVDKSLRIAPGLSNWKLFADRAFDGARVRVYRYVDGKCLLVRTATVARSLAGGDESENRLYFTQPGPEIRKGDEYVIDHRWTSIDPSVYRPFTAPGAEPVFGLSASQGSGPNALNVPIDLDLTTFAPVGGSTASYKLTTPAPPAPSTRPARQAANAGTTTVSNRFVFNRPGNQRLHETKPYTFRAWLKTDKPVTVRATVGTFASADLKLTPDWTLHQIKFTPAKDYKQDGPINLTVPPGVTLWMDNLGVFEDSLPPYAMYPHHAERLKSERYGYVRIWAWQVNMRWPIPLDAALKPPTSAPMRLDDRRTDHPAGSTLHQELEQALAIGSDPWIILNTLATDEELDNLMDYLAGPVTTRYGKLRAELGRPEPWTSAFNRILLEPGNETWNGNFWPQNFTGRGAQYGMWSQRMFERLAAHPGFSDAEFDFVLSGWMAQPDLKGFGLQAAANAPLADYVGMAGYLGGWDAGGELEVAAKAPYERMLVHERFYPNTFETAARDAAELSKTRAKPVRVVMYEAGPGYNLPGPGIPRNAVEQALGKSLGTALSWFEQVLRGARLDFGPQMFFLYREGDFWASHSDDGRPHITALGTTLLNTHFLEAEILEVTTANVPTVDLEQINLERNVPQRQGLAPLVRRRNLPAQKNVPLLTAYASRNAQGRLSIALISRSADTHLPVEIKLPDNAPKSFRLHLLTGPSPASSNVDKNEVLPTVLPEPITPDSGVLKLTLPPHALVVLAPEPAE